MANKLKGEVAFKALDSDWTLLIDWNAICTIETELDIKMNDISDALSTSATVIRSVFRIGLSHKHGELTDLEAGRLIGEVGPGKAAELLAQALAASFPEAANATEGPPKPTANRSGAPKKR